MNRIILAPRSLSIVTVVVIKTLLIFNKLVDAWRRNDDDDDDTVSIELLHLHTNTYIYMA